MIKYRVVTIRGTKVKYRVDDDIMNSEIANLYYGNIHEIKWLDTMDAEDSLFEVNAEYGKFTTYAATMTPACHINVWTSNVNKEVIERNLEINGVTDKVSIHYRDDYVSYSVDDAVSEIPVPTYLKVHDPSILFSAENSLGKIKTCFTEIDLTQKKHRFIMGYMKGVGFRIDEGVMNGSGRSVVFYK